jgi:hypothetical protein
MRSEVIKEGKTVCAEKDRSVARSEKFPKKGKAAFSLFLTIIVNGYL